MACHASEAIMVIDSARNSSFLLIYNCVYKHKMVAVRPKLHEPVTSYTEFGSYIIYKQN